MGVKKYLSLDRLEEYDVLIKEKIDSGDSSTLSLAKSHTNTEIAKITNGSVVVPEATHAASADTATTATSATSAGSATKATQDGNGKVISEQYETKGDASAKLAEAKEYTNTEVAKKADSGHNHNVATQSANGFMSSTDKTKLDGIATGANKTTVDSSLSGTSTNPVQNKVINSALNGKVPTTRTINGKALSSDVTLSASDVGADASGSANTALANAKTYTDQQIDLIVGEGAATTLDTIGEISAALKGNAGIIDTLASKTSLDTHTGNTTVHITAAERTSWNAAKTHADSAHAPSNAEKNQNAFSNVKVDTTTIAADTTTDTLTLAGSNVTITPDANADKVTIGITKGNVTAALGYTPPTENTWRGIQDNLTSTSTTDSLSANQGKVLKDLVDTKAGKSAATTSASGLMTAAMVTKLNGIAEGANKTIVDTALSSSSTNPVQNKVVNSAIAGVVETVSLNTQSINSHSTSITNLQNAVDDIQEITSQEIQNLFNS